MISNRSIFNASATDDDYRAAATELWCSDKVEIDADARVSSSERGAWVQVWVWIENQTEDEEDETNDL